MIRYITELPSSEWENSFPRPVVLLGSTGSIGVNTLRIIEKHPDLFQVVALAGGRALRLSLPQEQLPERLPMTRLASASLA